MSSEQRGLRERKKERTRQLIADTALRLFRERGFERVTIAEIAREADVAEKTVFNYFPAKEDLVYGRMESFEAKLLDAIRARGHGESALAAFGRSLVETRGQLAREQGDEQLRAINRMIVDSPTLLRREQLVFDRYTDALATLLREETRARPDDVAPWIAANALMGVHRALLEYVRRRSLAGSDNRSVARGARAQAKNAVATLERGFGSYAVKD